MSPFRVSDASMISKAVTTMMIFVESGPSLSLMFRVKVGIKHREKKQRKFDYVGEEPRTNHHQE